MPKALWAGRSPGRRFGAAASATSVPKRSPVAHLRTKLAMSGHISGTRAGGGSAMIGSRPDQEPNPR